MALPPGCSLSFEIRPAGQDCEALNDALGEFNKAFFRDPTYAHFAIFIRGDAGEIRAGLDAYVYAGWLFVLSLWIHGDLRRRGIGRELIGEAERRAVLLVCHSAWLDTFSFQAPGFYQKLGYEVFGVLDYPPDHKRYFLQKRLARGEA